jgi:hypothetical protein
MIAIHKIDGQYRPVILCDYCGTVIDDALKGMQLSSSAPEGATAQALYVHKGDCEQAMSIKLGASLGSEELSIHLLELIRNTLGKSDVQSVKNALDWAED